jgi:hypothetical protein
MYRRHFDGRYKPGWNRCECGLPLRLTTANNLVHYPGEHSEEAHDLVMRMKAAKAERS